MLGKLLTISSESAVGFMIIAALFALLNGFADNGGGIASTKLTVAMDASGAGAITVTNTSGFSNPSALAYVVIGDEDVGYANMNTTHFNPAIVRGLHGTTPSAHPVGTMVYSENAGAINAALGFDVASTKTTTGDVAIPVFAIKFITVTLPHILAWDFNFLRASTDPLVGLYRLFLMIISFGLILSIGMSLISLAMMGIFKR